MSDAFRDDDSKRELPADVPRPSGLGKDLKVPSHLDVLPDGRDTVVTTHMQGLVSDGPVLLLRISKEDYTTIQELIAFVPHMDRAIVGYPQPEIDRLAERFAAAPFSPEGIKELRLARGHLACLTSIFAAAPPPLSDRRDVHECLQELVNLSEQLSYFVNWELVAEEYVH